MRIGNYVWPGELVERMMALRGQGLSAEQIADRLGGNLTRSAVLGKLKRLGFNLGNAPRARPVKQPKPSDGRKIGVQVWSRVQGNSQRTKLVDQFEPVQPEALAAFDAAISLDRRVSLAALEPHHCKWPVGSPDAPGFFFCGGVRTTKAYCTFHHAVSVDRLRTMRVSEARALAPRGWRGG